VIYVRAKPRDHFALTLIPAAMSHSQPFNICLLKPASDRGGDTPAKPKALWAFGDFGSVPIGLGSFLRNCQHPILNALVLGNDSSVETPKFCPLVPDPALEQGTLGVLCLGHDAILSMRSIMLATMTPDHAGTPV
jgi:hypothetical protein